MTGGEWYIKSGTASTLATSPGELDESDLGQPTLVGSQMSYRIGTAPGPQQRESVTAWKSNSIVRGSWTL